MSNQLIITSTQIINHYGQIVKSNLSGCEKIEDCNCSDINSLLKNSLKDYEIVNFKQSISSYEANIDNYCSFKETSHNLKIVTFLLNKK